MRKKIINKRERVLAYGHCLSHDTIKTNTKKNVFISKVYTLKSLSYKGYGSYIAPPTLLEDSIRQIAIVHASYNRSKDRQHFYLLVGRLCEVSRMNDHSRSHEAIKEKKVKRNVIY